MRQVDEGGNAMDDDRLRLAALGHAVSWTGCTALVAALAAGHPRAHRLDAIAAGRWSSIARRIGTAVRELQTQRTEREIKTRKEREMSTKTLSLLLGLACALALTAGSARADDGGTTRIVFSAENVGDASAACGDALFGLSFDMVSPAGDLLGSGRSCVHSIDGCDPFIPGCRQTVRSTFHLDFGRGSLTVPMKLRELWPTESSFRQRAKGKISGGTGDFADARGHVKGGGAGAFTDQGFVGDFVYVVRLKGDAES